MSNTGTVWPPRPAMPMTSLTCTSRQARSQAPQAMQASRLTAIAGLEMSNSAISAASNFDGKRSLPEIPIDEAHCQNADWLSGPSAAGRMLLARSSNTICRDFAARSVPVLTTMPWVGWRMQEAASTRSPSMSTMQARQLPSVR
jgi:hypothetical protein